MKKSRYTDNQIIAILKQNEAGVSVADLCPEHGMSQASFCKWRGKYGGMDTSLIDLLPKRKAMTRMRFPISLLFRRSQNEEETLQKNKLLVRSGTTSPV